MAHRTTARWVGVLILAATATYMAGAGLIETSLGAPEEVIHAYPNRTRVIAGVLLQLANCAAAASIGVLMVPVVRKDSESVAFGYMVARALECVLLALGGVATLALVALSQEALRLGAADAHSFVALGKLLRAGSQMSYLVGMSALGLGSLPLCYWLYRSRCIPQSLALLGLVGYAALLIGSLVEIFGVNLNAVHYLPGGIFELIFPVWLIVKGFGVPDRLSQPSHMALLHES